MSGKYNFKLTNKFLGVARLSIIFIIDGRSVSACMCVCVCVCVCGVWCVCVCVCECEPSKSIHQIICSSYLKKFLWCCFCIITIFCWIFCLKFVAMEIGETGKYETKNVLEST